MGNLWQIFVNSLSGAPDSAVSSRRLVTMIIVMLCVITNFGVIFLAFIVAMRPVSESVSPIQALDKLIEVVIIENVTALLMIGIITWQNVNDTVSLIRGGGITQNIAKAADQIQEKAQDIKEAVAAAPPDPPVPQQPVPQKNYAA